jgi:hypothetical protein
MVDKMASNTEEQEFTEAEQEIIDALKAKMPDHELFSLHVETHLGSKLIVFRGFTQPEGEALVDTMGDSKNKSLVARKHVRKIIVHPSLEVFDEYLSKRGGIATNVLGEASAFYMGMRGDAAKKL